MLTRAVLSRKSVYLGINKHILSFPYSFHVPYAVYFPLLTFTLYFPSLFFFFIIRTRKQELSIKRFTLVFVKGLPLYQKCAPLSIFEGFCSDLYSFKISRHYRNICFQEHLSVGLLTVARFSKSLFAQKLYIQDRKLRADKT